MSFQSFEALTRPEQGPPRLAMLRAAMRAAGLAAFLVPRADAHQGETVAPADERLAWLTGFTGSAGFCAVTQDEAGLFVDGRYRVQARAQVASPFTPVAWPETTLADWLGAGRLASGDRVGFDPWLHVVEEVERLRAALGPKGIALAPGENLVDRIWHDRPAPPDAPFTLWPEDLAGASRQAKRARVAEALREAGHRAAVLTLPDSIAWLLNIRGADVARTPVPHAFAILHDDGACELFARPGKAEEIRDALGEGVRLHPEGAFLDALESLPSPVRLDPKSAPQRVLDRLAEAGVEIARAIDPCVLPKARKSAAEIAATEEAHRRDGAAVTRFLAWLDREAPKGELTEIAVVRALEGFRRETNALLDISFDTIAGTGAHGAIIHYRVTRETDAPVREGELIVIDSGGQYLDGTTDITRTVAVGAPPEGAREAYTRVLQGHIAIARLRFPKGLAGQHLDAVARVPLWLAGQDYDHGTGHGVGVHLSVHEGPAGLHRRSETPLEPGMILSNEPGYYREGAFGIRIENLVVVEEAPAIPGGDDRAMLAFRTLSFAPLDRRLIVVAMLADAERDWVDAYHAEVARVIGPRLEGRDAAWLADATRAL